MKILRLPVGSLGTNCYIVADEDKGLCAVIDPGAEGERITAVIKDRGWTVDKVLLTHGHADHIGGVQYLLDTWQAPLYIAKGDEAFLTDDSLNLSSYTGTTVKVNAKANQCKEGDIITVGSLSLEVIETPGHTPGGICFYCKADKILFAGDTLFYESVGRTDFPGGSMNTLIDHVSNKLMALPEDTIVYPGHGPETTIGHEKEYNPFI